MARSFAAASSQYISGAAAPVTATPLSLAALGKAGDDTILLGAVSVAETNAVTSHRHNLTWAGNVAGHPVRAVSQDTVGNTFASTTTAFTKNVTASGVAVFASDADRTAYINGGSSGNNTTSRSPVNLNRTRVGAIGNQNTQINFWSGDLSEIGIWGAALTAREATSLKLYAPHRVRPTALLFCARLINNIHDLSRSRVPLTNNGTTQAARHPRIFS